MIHEQVDLARWKTEFSLERLRRDAREFVLNRREQMPDRYPDEAAVERHVRLLEPDGGIVESAKQLAITEQLREEANIPESWERIAADVFTMVNGEAPTREMTKIGGLPFWPSGRDWPTFITGEPMTFIGQFCFGDSDDLVGLLPGDVLIIFGIDHDSILGEEESAIHFSWINRGVSELISAEEQHESSWKIAPYYGQIYRTYDLTEVHQNLTRYRGSEKLAVMEGTKIGGLPRWIQQAPQMPGRFLCALGGTDDLDWGDAGSLYVFVTEDGELHWTVQCY
ncbi:MAG TPA: DUF1963 domain-containing protein [Dehalococcoidia bacterium]|jgi:uncharacterized protein YwqG|nr:DUF1963 domain-containing protein [Dehalococcoidia bacterium]